MTTARILVVEDESPMRRLIQELLEGDGFSVRAAATAEDALAELRRGVPDLAVLDVRLPGQSGFDLCRKMRSSAEWRKVPVIFLTSRGEQAEKVAGLELGGDDYVTKPFGAPELLARVRAVLRRAKDDSPAPLLKGGAIHMDAAARRVKVKDRELTLTQREFELLRIFLQKPGTTLTRAYLTGALDGGESEALSRSVDQLVYRLRKSLGRHGACIQAVEGVGYRWKNL